MEPWVKVGLVVAAEIAVLLPLLVRWWSKAAVERAVEKKFREWEVRFSMLHERRIGVLEAVKEHVVDAQQALDAAQVYLDASIEGEELDELLGEADLAWRRATRTLASRQFYLPPETGRRVERLLHDIRWTNLHATFIGDSSGDKDDLQIAREESRQAYLELRDRLPNVIEEIDGEFRWLVGEWAPVGKKAGSDKASPTK